MPIELPTAQALFDIYKLLPRADQVTFLRLLGSISTAEVPFIISQLLSNTQRFRLAGMMTKQVTTLMLPVLIERARLIAKEVPEASDEEFDRQLREQINETMDRINRDILELARAELKEGRDRKSNPEIVRRNVEICDLRRQNPGLWSLGQLAMKFKKKKQTIKRILEEEDKWRRLSAQDG